MSVEQVIRIFNRNHHDLAFILGNGINLYYENDGVSWNDLLLDLWQTHSFNTQSTIPHGISFTEFYDALEIQNASDKKFSSLLQKDVQRRMKEWEANLKQNLILERIHEMNSQILTTNFDKLIPKSMNLEFNRMEGTNFTDFYPWSNYYSNYTLNYPTAGFGVWYINGMARYHRSIKLGLSQYMGNVERARRLIHKKPENINFEGKNQEAWPGYKTWLHIIFNKSLVIVGLGLNETEVFLRWLLIERAKYFRRFPNRKHNGWFIKKSSPRNSDGQKFFLNSVGFEVIELDEYTQIYEDIWR